MTPRPTPPGGDVGTQYRSAVFYHNPDQEKTARQVIEEFNDSKVWKKPIVTEVVAYREFYKRKIIIRIITQRTPGNPTAV